VNPAEVRTKAAAHNTLTVQPGSPLVLRLRLTAGPGEGSTAPSSASAAVPFTAAFEDFDGVFARRSTEAADEF
jgi:hypothetical protein